jgi:hypothetical protein
MTIQIRDWIYEFVVFGIKEARACVFAGSFFVLLKLSQRYLARPCAAGLQAAPAGAGGARYCPLGLTRRIDEILLSFMPRSWTFR